MSDQPDERRDRYAAAIRAESSRVDDIALAEAVMAVADAEQVEYEETVVGNLNEINTRLQAENAQLLAQVEEARQARLRAENDARTAKREAAAPSAPTDRDLCDRIAEALYRQDWPLKQVWMQALAGDRTRYEALADAVLAVLPAPATTDVREIVNCLIAHAQGFQDVLDESDRDPWARLVRADIDALRTAIAALPEPADDAGTVGYWQAKLAAVTDGRDSLQRETARLHRELASAERIRENADFHLGQEMARRQRAEKEMRRMADEAQQTTASGVDLPTLAAALDGLHTLIATSSRDWGTYRVDAWIWAVLCGWDCEEAEHDDTCTHGAMEEMAAQHGWSTDAVAKAHRYRAAVRHLTDGAQTEVDRIVARRSPATSSVYCTTHGTPEMTPLTSDDLPDGAHCQICGADVLIPQTGDDDRG